MTCFLDIDPISNGHTLIVPKRHYLDVDELDPETAASVMQAAATISLALKRMVEPDGISIMQNGGHFNDVGHYHMHVFPRYRGDGFGWTYGAVEPSDLKRIQSQLSEAISGVSRSDSGATIEGARGE